ncbi:hypothetical protein TrRE_jg13435 [Triparma retinervis]|uniref:Uncharacterized protein n=1 Tax=Triparma retinervis TaxID=2557542 RepID=A0A9W7L7C0_9STRA|nr:hypothetical protein TrRE_jg13435 [Triparma retinervis]
MLNMANGMTRDKKHPLGKHKKGLPTKKTDQALKERAANYQMSIFTNIVRILQRDYPKVAWSLENGKTSFIWQTPQIKRPH